MGTGWFDDAKDKTPIWGEGAGGRLQRPLPAAANLRGVRRAFSAAGVVAGVAGAVLAYMAWSSIVLSIVVFLTVNTYFSRGLGEVATKPNRGRRFLYVTLQPLLISGLVAGIYLASGILWLSAVAGAVAGLFLWLRLGAALFPDVHGEAMRELEKRMTSGEG